MTIINAPTQLFHTGTSSLQDIPSANSSNAFFRRYWVYFDANGFRFNLEKVISIDEVDNYTINIGPRDFFWNSGFVNPFESEGKRLEFEYALRIGILSRAEESGIPNLTPLDSETEEEDYEAFLLDLYA